MAIVRKHKRRTNKGLTRVKQHKRKVKKKSINPKQIQDITFEITKGLTKKPLSPNIKTKSDIVKYDFIEGKGLVRKYSPPGYSLYGKPTLGQKMSRFSLKPRKGYVVMGTTRGVTKDLDKKGLTR